MTDWSFLSDLFSTLQAHSPMLGRLWLLLMLVFRMLILGTVASDLFNDEQEEFSCNTLQPGCKQVCYDEAFPISQYRFWVFHIVLISTPALIFLVYAMHHHKKRHTLPPGTESSQERRLKRLYGVNVGFRLLSELGFLVGQWWLYGFHVEAQFPCSRFPCPHTVDCFTSRPMEKTVFLVFYFFIGLLSTLSSLAELVHVAWKWSLVDGGLQTNPEFQEKSDGEVLSQKVAWERMGPARVCPGRKGRNIGRSKWGTVRNNSTKYFSIRRKSLRGDKSRKSVSLVV